MPKMASECTILHLGNKKNYGGMPPDPPTQHAPVAHEIDFLKFSAPGAILQSHPWIMLRCSELEKNVDVKTTVQTHDL